MIPKALIDSSSLFLYEEAEKMGLNPRWETKFGLFSFEYRGKREYMYHTKVHNNSQLGAWVCKNKHASHVVLEEAGLPTIPYCRPKTRDELYTFFDTYKIIVKKPVAGMQAKGVSLINDKSLLVSLPFRLNLFEQYIHGVEYRYLVLNDKVIAAQEKKLDPTRKDPWNPSVRNIRESEWDSRATDYALRTSALLHMKLLAVDFIVDEKDVLRILEINDTPSLHFFHKPHRDEPVNISKILLQELFLK